MPQGIEGSTHFTESMGTFKTISKEHYHLPLLQNYSMKTVYSRLIPMLILNFAVNWLNSVFSRAVKKEASDLFIHKASSALWSQ